MEQQKTCRACGEIKLIGDFPPDRRAPDGKQARCRACINMWMKNHYRARPAEHMLRRAFARARRHGLEFSLSVDDLLPLPVVCPVFGVPLRISDGQQDPWAYSLDRIENSKGYVKGNVAVMSYKANRLKNDGTADDHETIAAWMRKQAALTANS